MSTHETPKEFQSGCTITNLPHSQCEHCHQIVDLHQEIENVLQKKEKLLELCAAVKEYRQAKFKDENVAVTWHNVEKILKDL